MLAALLSMQAYLLLSTFGLNRNRRIRGMRRRITDRLLSWGKLTVIPTVSLNETFCGKCGARSLRRLEQHHFSLIEQFRLGSTTSGSLHQPL
jgi:hypothetical protein